MPKLLDFDIKLLEVMCRVLLHLFRTYSLILDILYPLNKNQFSLISYPGSK